MNSGILWQSVAKELLDWLVMFLRLSKPSESQVTSEFHVTTLIIFLWKCYESLEKHSLMVKMRVFILRYCTHWLLSLENLFLNDCINFMSFISKYYLLSQYVELCIHRHKLQYLFHLFLYLNAVIKIQSVPIRPLYIDQGFLTRF